MQEPHIRKAKREDAASICEFNLAMAMETEGLKLDEPTLATGVDAIFDHPERGFYVVTEIEEQVVGSLMVTTEWSDWRNGFFWWIQSVYVRPEFRRRGIYSAMYRFVQKLAEKEPDVFGFRLYVEKENHAAQKTYEKLGMHETHYKLFEEPKGGR